MAQPLNFGQHALASIARHTVAMAELLDTLTEMNADDALVVMRQSDFQKLECNANETFAIDDAAWILRRKSVAVAVPCNGVSHYGDSCPNCKGTGTRQRTELTGALYPVEIIIDAIIYDCRGVTYCSGGGADAGERHSEEEVFATEQQAQEYADRIAGTTDALPTPDCGTCDADCTDRGKPHNQRSMTVDECHANRADALPEPE